MIMFGYLDDMHPKKDSLWHVRQPLIKPGRCTALYTPLETECYINIRSVIQMTLESNCQYASIVNQIFNYKQRSAADHSIKHGLRIPILISRSAIGF